MLYEKLFWRAMIIVILFLKKINTSMHLWLSGLFGSPAAQSKNDTIQYINCTILSLLSWIWRNVFNKYSTFSFIHPLPIIHRSQISTIHHSIITKSLINSEQPFQLRFNKVVFILVANCGELRVRCFRGALAFCCSPVISTPQ